MVKKRRNYFQNQIDLIACNANFPSLGFEKKINFRGTERREKSRENYKKSFCSLPHVHCSAARNMIIVCAKPHKKT